MKIGLQLYTLRNYTKDNFFETLKKVKEAGYDGVEFAGYFDIPAEEMKEQLDKNGLVAVGSHVGYELLVNDLERQIEYAKTLNAYSVVCPGFHGDSAEKWIEAAKIFNEIGKKFKENGIIFGYHNHAHEFNRYDGKYAIDLLYENSDPEYVVCEFDTYWIKKGGEIPEKFIKKYAGRCPLIHAKDLATDNQTDIEVGRGSIDFPAVVNAAGNVQWIIVEQEAFNMDEFESIKISCDNLKKMFK